MALEQVLLGAARVRCGNAERVHNSALNFLGLPQGSYAWRRYSSLLPPRNGCGLFCKRSSRDFCKRGAFRIEAHVEGGMYPEERKDEEGRGGVGGKWKEFVAFLSRLSDEGFRGLREFQVDCTEGNVQWPVQCVAVLVLCALCLGALLRGPHVMLSSRRHSDESLTRLTEAQLERGIQKLKPKVSHKLNEARWSEGFNLRNYKLGQFFQVNALAAEINADDEEARQEYEAWKAKPYAITVPVRIVGLRGSVPPVWLKDFVSSQGKRVKLVAEFQGNLRNIYSDLKSGKASEQLNPKSALAADLVTIGDSWLGKAISEGLIRPIENAEKYEWYQRLGEKWQKFLRRNEDGNLDPNGKVWGVPYRWGSLVIAFNTQKLQKQKIPAIEDWGDLWKPELTGRIAMVASPREVIGAVLKALGASYNVMSFETDVPGGRQAVEEKFKALQNQVRVFDDTQYLKTLGAGEVWVAVGWSGDVIPFAKRSSNIVVISPRSGTSLWADLWAIPATTTSSMKVGGRIRGPSPLIFQWLDFCLQPARASSFQKDVFVGASPLVLTDDKEADKDGKVFHKLNSPVTSEKDNTFDLEQVTDQNPLDQRPVTVDCIKKTDPNLTTLVAQNSQEEGMARSEFLEPLSETALDDFKWLLSRAAEGPKFRLGFLNGLTDKFQNLSWRIPKR